MKIISASASALALPLVLAKAENLRGVEATAIDGRALTRQLEENTVVAEEKFTIVAKSIDDCWHHPVNKEGEGKYEKYAWGGRGVQRGA